MATQVTFDAVVVRSAPGTGADSTIIGALHPGMSARVLEGPQRASGYDWYRVTVGDLEGWAAAADTSGEPWLAPLENGELTLVMPREATPGVTSDACNVWLYDSLRSEGAKMLQGCGAVWSADGMQLAFGAPSEALSPLGELSIASADGDDIRRIVTDPEAGIEGGPQWAPDGSALAYIGRDSSFQAYAFVIGTSGADLARAPDIYAQGDISWAPDSSRFAFNGLQERANNLFIMDRTGAVQRLTNFAPEETAISAVHWSPDGTVIAFTLISLEPRRVEIWLIPPDGTEARPLTTQVTPSTAHRSMAWAPDGKSLAVLGVAQPPLLPGEGDFEILLVNRDGSVAAVGLSVPHAQSLRNLVWSPDGQYLAAYAETCDPATCEFIESGVVSHYEGVEGAAWVIDLAAQAVTVVPGSSGLTPTDWRPLPAEASIDGWLRSNGSLAWVKLNTGVSGTGRRTLNRSWVAR